jgi:hypothetical protein
MDLASSQLEPTHKHKLVPVLPTQPMLMMPMKGKC